MRHQKREKNVFAQIGLDGTQSSWQRPNVRRFPYSRRNHNIVLVNIWIPRRVTDNLNDKMPEAPLGLLYFLYVWLKVSCFGRRLSHGGFSKSQLLRCRRVHGFRFERKIPVILFCCHKKYIGELHFFPSSRLVISPALQQTNK